ncbi:MAG: RluA family pseudouridine synthase [Caldicoprobacter oshimai]|uniref:Pseudouridine synthase n=1 Tax=Caldicoprobacter faecalis TaxID=937334 RepID=A0A1I5SEA1_9FIRM|nr:RluA family pseudouridine synthase [Caldicoprobacter faecalis]PZN11369.1 MAG: RluA family pseudouridine synthase [Caldicoprobacter oshimai]SFP69035.1 ribosomal large subunit pseudouridine synthase D [Caldicoprobacter faecalis]
METLRFEVEQADDKKRIDVFLAEKISEYSRSYIQKLIKDGLVLVNGEKVKPNFKVKPGCIIDVTIPPPQEISLQPEPMELDIVYEDDDIVVVNKPQGMVVHPAPGNYSGTLVNALLYSCDELSGIGGIIRPGIVHRLDKDTSGLLVVAKNDAAHRSLAQQLKDRTLKRVYWCIVEKNIKGDKGVINAPIGRHPINRKKMAVLNAPTAKPAVTHFKVLERFGEYTLVEARLETGRTHQIRVHMAYIGHPVVGDSVYGSRKQKFNLKGQVLHAKKLGLIHPSTGEYMEFEAPLPEYFENLLDILRKNYTKN